MKLYELVGQDDRRFSPYCWRTRMALAHKGLDANIIPVGFTEKDKIAFSGQDKVPVIDDGGVIVSDSWDIACYLEETYPDRPSLFGDEGTGGAAKGQAMFLNAWVDRALHLAILPLIIADLYGNVRDEDQPYFRESREKRFGKPLDKIQAAREANRPALDAALGPIRATIKAQPFICGDAPAYGDYIIFGAFQWARCASPFELIAADDPVSDWRHRIGALYDGLAQSVPHYN